MSWFFIAVNSKIVHCSPQKYVVEDFTDIMCMFNTLIMFSILCIYILFTTSLRWNKNKWMTRVKKAKKMMKSWYCIFNLENVDCFFHIKCTVIENTFYNQNVYQEFIKKKKWGKTFPRMRIKFISCWCCKICWYQTYLNKTFCVSVIYCLIEHSWCRIYSNFKLVMKHFHFI